jgi:hypothetical protein
MKISILKKKNDRETKLANKLDKIKREKQKKLKKLHTNKPADTK